MLEPSGWLSQAQAVPEGRERRGHHDCGASSLVVGNKPDGWWAWCHRCHDKGWVPKPAPTLEERTARRAAQDAADRALQDVPTLPHPYVFDVPSWPAEAAVWLFKAGLFVEDIAALGAYYHPPSQRVVLPVMAGGEVVHWQARDVGLCGPRAPKYIGPRARAGTVIPRWGDDDAVVLTEDLLSAFRVGMAGEGWCLMGTSLSAPLARLLVLQAKPVILWLDPDKAGENAAATISRELSLYGLRHTQVHSKADPKLLSRAEVARHIEEAKHGLLC